MQGASEGMQGATEGMQGVIERLLRANEVMIK
jgi:hypothetical protein